MEKTLSAACMAAMLMASAVAAPACAESIEQSVGRGRQDQARAMEAQWRRVDREIISADKALVRSEKALQQGRTPLPGERTGKVGGGSRLTEAYFQRVHGLEAAVEQAKQRLDLAYAARNALK